MPLGPSNPKDNLAALKFEVQRVVSALHDLGDSNEESLPVSRHSLSFLYDEPSPLLNEFPEILSQCLLIQADLSTLQNSSSMIDLSQVESFGDGGSAEIAAFLADCQAAFHVLRMNMNLNGDSIYDKSALRSSTHLQSTHELDTLEMKIPHSAMESPKLAQDNTAYGPQSSLPFFISTEDRKSLESTSQITTEKKGSDRTVVKVTNPGLPHKVRWNQIGMREILSQLKNQHTGLMFIATYSARLVLLAPVWRLTQIKCARSEMPKPASSSTILDVPEFAESAHSARKWAESLQRIENVSVPGWADLSTGLFLGVKDSRSAEPVSSRYIITCQLQEFYQRECKGYERMNDALIVFGDGMNARCLSCEEYCKHKISGVSDISKGILEILNFAATVTGTGEHRTTFHPYSSTWIEFSAKVSDMEPTKKSTDKTISLSHTQIHLSITTNLPWLLREDIDTLLTSLVAALRPKQEPGLAISEARLKRDDGVITISLLPLDLVVQEACWHPLFPRKVISREALTREEGFFGLQMSFDLMIMLCGTDVAMLEQGGLCLEGVYTSLIPIRVKQRRDVQWHLFCVDQDKRESSDFRCNLWNVQMPKDWYKTDDLETLRGDRFATHYIGWCGSCAITVGTLLQNGRSVKESKAPVVKTEKIHSSTSFTANASIHGVGVGLSKTTTRASPARSPFEDRERPFTLWLTGSMSEQVLLYSPSKQQAWMVSKTSLLLQLVREHISLISQADRTLNYYLPECTNESATPLNAYHLLKEHLGAKLPVLSAQCPFTVENLLLIFLHLLDKLSRRRTAASWSQRFCGFELADVINQPHEFQLKEANVSHIRIGSPGGWTKLLDKIPLVLFFEGLEDPILPIPGSGESPAGTICCCSRMPINKNLLATTLSSLRTLTKDFEYMDSGRLTATTYWHCPNSTHLFRACNCNDTTPDKRRLQSIWPRNSAQPPAMNQIEKHPGGALIFASGLGILNEIAG